jgi:hypothetical protein
LASQISGETVLHSSGHAVLGALENTCYADYDPAIG